MSYNFAFFFNSIFLGVGLAMDAFSVSMANGLNEPRMSRLRMNAIAGVYGLFQFLMPMLGWICLHTIVSYFDKLQTFIPWIAMLLLLYIGSDMLVDGLKTRKAPKTERPHGNRLTFGKLLMQGIATSIDALSVGFTIEQYDGMMAFVASLIIAVVTHIICLIGLAIGKKVGLRLSWRAGVLGGSILILIGFEIFISGIFG